MKYGDAVHTFNQKVAGDGSSKGAAYDAEADKRSWLHMRGLFADILVGP